MTPITTSVVDSYLRLIRRPVDIAVGVLPGPRTGPRAAARLIVERVDASVRSVVGAALRDESLRHEATQRAAAADERELAMTLREQAELAKTRGEERVQQRHETAGRQRHQAQERAAGRRKQADRTAATRARQARETEAQRLVSAEKQAQREQKRIARSVERERLRAVEHQAEALKDRKEALTLAQEAELLGDSAASAKQARKS